MVVITTYDLHHRTALPNGVKLNDYLVVNILNFHDVGLKPAANDGDQRDRDHDGGRGVADAGIDGRADGPR